MDDAERGDSERRLVDNQVAVLMEHFDTVQIFCTRSDPDRGITTNIDGGNGNWFARRGQVRDWVRHHDGVVEGAGFSDEG